MPEVKWTLHKIRDGIDQFKAENGHMPTAFDFDRTVYLPSARQIQRAYGGLEALRKQLGYDELNYTKGDLRRLRSHTGHVEGTAAEDMLEQVLIAHFGEPYVHTQKRYYTDHKNRYDFFIYYRNGFMGIDIFTTKRIEYIGPNIRHKLIKYKNVPNTTPIYFVVASEKLTPAQVQTGTATARGLLQSPNIQVIHLSKFIEQLQTFPPLDLPIDIKLVL
jgi:hypothetical protein